MSSTRWNEVENLLQAALDRDPDERAAFLVQACGGDEDLRREVSDLLARAADAPLFSDGPAVAGAPEPLNSATISHYRVEHRIGAGGMGEVYLAYDELLRRTVAVKVLPAAFTADAERVRRFEQEALAASRLNHPNIITIFETIHSGDAHFIVTELVDGPTLRVLAKEPLGLSSALDIAVQICAALQAAHGARIIHRDIKPENVMVRSDGLVKVLDFGIAKLGEESLASGARGPATDSLTMPGAVLGTARYMSPEQARGEWLDERTDLYSLGVVLREMLAGTPVPKSVQRIIDKALQPRREDRYASATAMLTDLRAQQRRIGERSARRRVRLTTLAAVAAVAAAAWLSIYDVWDERIIRDGHTAAAREVAFSPDGRLLVSCGEDGKVMAWDFAARQRLWTIEETAVKVAFTPDGRSLATGRRDGVISVWDVARRVKQRELRSLRGEVGALAFSPDGALLLATDYGLPGRFAWNTSSWTEAPQRPRPGAYGTFVFSSRQILFSSDLPANWAALSPDGRALAAVDAAGHVSFFRLPDGDLERRQLVARIRPHQDNGRSIAFSPDGRLVASAADDIVLFDAASHQPVARFEYPSIAWSVAFSPDGRWLVSSHGDGAVLVWNVVKRKCAASLAEHSGAVRAVAFSPDGTIIASAGDDQSVLLWDAATGKKRAVLAGHDTRVTAVAFSRRGSALVSADQDGALTIWDPAAHRPRGRIPPLKMSAHGVAIAPDGRTIATTQGIYDRQGRLRVDFEAFSDQWKDVYGVAFSPDGQRLATACEGGWMALFDVGTLRMLSAVRVPNVSLISVSFSADGTHLATGEDEGAVRLWSVAPLRQVAILGRHAARIKAVAFAPDGATVASAGDDKIIALWDVARRRLRATVGIHTSPVDAIAFSPDGRQLVSGEHDHSVRIYTRRRMLWGLRLQ